jgi:hypothetical protein
MNVSHSRNPTPPTSIYGWFPLRRGEEQSGDCGTIQTIKKVENFFQERQSLYLSLEEGQKLKKALCGAYHDLTEPTTAERYRNNTRGLTALAARICYLCGLSTREDTPKDALNVFKMALAHQLVAQQICAPTLLETVGGDIARYCEKIVEELKVCITDTKGFVEKIRSSGDEEAYNTAKILAQIIFPAFEPSQDFNEYPEIYSAAWEIFRQLRAEGSSEEIKKEAHRALIELEYGRCITRIQPLLMKNTPLTQQELKYLEAETNGLKNLVSLVEEDEGSLWAQRLSIKIYKTLFLSTDDIAYLEVVMKLAALPGINPLLKNLFKVYCVMISFAKDFKAPYLGQKEAYNMMKEVTDFCIGQKNDHKNFFAWYLTAVDLAIVQNELGSALDFLERAKEVYDKSLRVFGSDAFSSIELDKFEKVKKVLKDSNYHKNFFDWHVNAAELSMEQNELESALDFLKQVKGIHDKVIKIFGPMAFSPAELQKFEKMQKKLGDAIVAWVQAEAILEESGISPMSLT